jgi:hypothetical protein
LSRHSGQNWTPNPRSILDSPCYVRVFRARTKPWFCSREPSRDRMRFTRTYSCRASTSLAGVFRIVVDHFCTCELWASAGSSRVQKTTLPVNKTPARRVGGTFGFVRVNEWQYRYPFTRTKTARTRTATALEHTRDHAKRAPRHTFNPILLYINHICDHVLT